jgi:hypothetical protein
MAKNQVKFLNSKNLSLVEKPNLLLQCELDLRKPDLRKNLNLRKIVVPTDFLVHKLFDLRKIFLSLMFDLRKIFFFFKK